MSNTGIDIHQDHLACTVCGRLYPMSGQEYCEHDGERLQMRVGAAAIVPEPEPEPVPAAPCAVHSTTADAAPVAKPGPDSAPETPAAAAAADLDSKLARFGVRRKTAAPPAAGAAASASTAQAEREDDDGSNPLPPEVRLKGWKVAGPLTLTEAADAWPVERASSGATGPARARFCRYRTSVLTRMATYQRLLESPCAALPALLAHGAVDLKGRAPASYELTMLPAREPLQRLADWIDLAPPSEGKARALLPHLVQLLSELADAGLQPLYLSPTQLLRSQDGHLILDNLACLAEAGQAATADYRPELAQNGLLNRVWCAPELGEQLVVSPNAAVFSVGQILAQATWGKPAELVDLRSGDISLHGIADAGLARILEGCLWIHSANGRWTHAQLKAAASAKSAAQMPNAPDWAQLGPRAMKAAYPFSGRAFWRVEDLMQAAVKPKNWALASAEISKILEWVNGSPWQGLARQVRSELEAGRTADYALVKLAHGVVAGLDKTFRTLDLSDGHARSSLVELAQRNLADDTTPEEAALLDALFDADLRGAFAAAAQPEPAP